MAVQLLLGRQSSHTSHSLPVLPASCAGLPHQVPILRDRSGDMVLKFIGIDPSSFWYDIGMLWLLFLAFNVGTYIALVIRMRSTNDVVS